MKLAVVWGGPSSEAEVSRVSATAVHAALQQAGHECSLLELGAPLATQLLALQPEVVVPMCHGRQGEDGCLQGLLEILELPYVGSGVRASALAMDKTSARVHFAAAGLPIAAGVSSDDAEDALGILMRLGDRLVVKPADGGSAVGVTCLHNTGMVELVGALREALTLGERALVEKMMPGDEVTCGVLHLHGEAPRALPPTRILPHAAAHYDYVSRYAAGQSTHQCPAPYDAALLREIQRVAVDAHRALGCRDLSRVDFLVDSSTARITLLEVNTLPGFTSTSLFPEAAAVQGLSFSALCETLVDSARRRGTREAGKPRAFPR